MTRMLRILCASLLLAAAPAASAMAAQLRPMPDVAPGVAAFPRLVAPPGDRAAARINAALTKADARAKIAAGGCTPDKAQGRDGWTRSITVTMRGPRYLSLLASNEWDCGAYPDTDQVALVYDLHTGAPVDWARLLARGMLAGSTTNTASDETTEGLVTSPVLAAAFRKAAAADAGRDKQCAEVLSGKGQFGALVFQLWPDAQANGLALEFPTLPHVVAVCGAPEIIPAAELRKLGVGPVLLAPLATAHRDRLYGMGR